ncbi:MAG: molecular chaperone TorD family protein [Methanophagales archaeon]|nr:molecular chaperone TorD family protein [Methanophagales archaeon]
MRILKEFIEKSKGKAIDELHEALIDEYTRLFIGPHRLPVQPYESWWMDGKRMLYECELSDFYKGIAKLTKGFLLLEDAVIEELLETVL